MEAAKQLSVQAATAASRKLMAAARLHIEGRQTTVSLMQHLARANQGLHEVVAARGAIEVTIAVSWWLRLLLSGLSTAPTALLCGRSPTPSL